MARPDHAVQVLAGAGEPERDRGGRQPRRPAAPHDPRPPRPRREHHGEQGEERRHRLQHHLGGVLDAPGVERQPQPTERRHERQQERGERPEHAPAVRATVRCGSGRSLLGPAVIGTSGISGAGGQRREHQARDDLGQRRMLGPVVLAQEHAGIAGLEPRRVQLPGAEVVVLVEVGVELADGEHPRAERDEKDRYGDREQGKAAEAGGLGVHRLSVAAVSIPHDRMLSGPGPEIKLDLRSRTELALWPARQQPPVRRQVRPGSARPPGPRRRPRRDLRPRAPARGPARGASASSAAAG